jgi:hypothetical protein
MCADAIDDRTDLAARTLQLPIPLPVHQRAARGRGD